jgi:hypothetical protein
MSEEKDLEIRGGIIQFSAGKPIEIVDTSRVPADVLSEPQQSLLSAVGSTVHEYLKTCRLLLNGKYARIREYAPPHLRDPCMVIAICCEDGIIIRYDTRDDRLLGTGWGDEKLPELAPKISEGVVYCHHDRNFTSRVPQTGPKMTLEKIDGATGAQTEIISARVGFDVVLEAPTQPLPTPPSKPYCLLSVRNSLDIELVGETLPSENSGQKSRKFLLRTTMILPVGWQCIEIFPFADVNHWKPEYARMWAENDLLAAVVRGQFREAQLRTLDPNAAARKEFSNLLEAYKALLDSNPEREEVLQSFLKENPVLLCPTYTMVRPKLQIGARVTDFVFQAASGDYLLVELEKSTDPLFIRSGDTSSKLNHARDQISDWRRYIEDNLSTVQHELGLPGISSNPKGLIVIGRAQSLSEENRRKLVTLENGSPRTKIMTYDDVFTNAKVLIENLLGPLWLGSGNTEVYYFPEGSQRPPR